MGQGIPGFLIKIDYTWFLTVTIAVIANGHGLCINMAWAADKWTQVISNIIILKTVIPLRN